jgi:hypothetical protein
MKFSSISQTFFDLCSFDGEILEKDNSRPYLVIVRLKFRGQRQDFAIPFRSNIANHIPRDQYFSLPPRPTTRANRIHGLHYIKMFPIKKQYLQKYHTKGDPYYDTLLEKINRELNIIIQEAQSYIERYEQGIRIGYSTDIDRIYATIYGFSSESEVAAASPDNR